MHADDQPANEPSSTDPEKPGTSSLPVFLHSTDLRPRSGLVTLPPSLLPRYIRSSILSISSNEQRHECRSMSKCEGGHEKTASNPLACLLPFKVLKDRFLIPLHLTFSCSSCQSPFVSLF